MPITTEYLAAKLAEAQTQKDYWASRVETLRELLSLSQQPETESTPPSSNATPTQ